MFGLIIEYSSPEPLRMDDILIGKKYLSGPKHMMHEHAHKHTNIQSQARAFKHTWTHSYMYALCLSLSLSHTCIQHKTTSKKTFNLKSSTHFLPYSNCKQKENQICSCTHLRMQHESPNPRRQSPFSTIHPPAPSSVFEARESTSATSITIVSLCR